MGVAAYQRGSKVIREQLSRDFEKSGSANKDLREQMLRAELKIIELEQFCRDAQAFLIECEDEDTARGLVRKSIHYNWLKKRNTKSFKKLKEQCAEAHCKWVDSDRRYVFNHLSICILKAQAWKKVLDKLNTTFRLPFNIPNTI